MIPRRFFSFAVAAVATLLLGAPLAGHAQTGAQIDTQQDLLRREQQGLERPSVEVNAGDPDLGEINLVSRTPRPKMFTFSTAQNFHYTSNAFLVPFGEQGALFWNGRFDAAFVPYATRNFTPRLTFEQNFFRYDNAAVLDFDSQSLQLDARYDLNPDDTWFVAGSYAVARLYSPRGSVGEFYRYGLLTGSITHVRQLGGTPIYLAGTFGGTFRHGDPSAFDRVTTFLNATLLYSPLDPLQLSVFMRPEVQFYTNDPLASGRTDFNLNVGASATLTPVEYVSVGVVASFIGNYSSSDPRDYEVFSPSIVLGARVAF